MNYSETQQGKNPFPINEARWSSFVYLIQSDSHLIRLSSEILGPNRWANISLALENFGIQKTAKQCKERWENNLKPGLYNSLLSDEEEIKIIEELSLKGKLWKSISECIPSRSSNFIKNWYNQMMKKINIHFKKNRKILYGIKINESFILASCQILKSSLSNLLNIDLTLISNNSDKINEVSNSFAQVIEKHKKAKTIKEKKECMT